MTRQRKPDRVLADGDYVADDGLWVSCRGVAIRIVPYDTGIRIDAYRDGDEMGEPFFKQRVAYPDK